MKTIILRGEVVLAVNLSYRQANEALKKANKHRLAEDYTFHITNEYSDVGTWSLCARHKATDQNFSEDPDSFVIVVEGE